MGSILGIESPIYEVSIDRVGLIEQSSNRLWQFTVDTGLKTVGHSSPADNFVTNLINKVGMTDYRSRGSVIVAELDRGSIRFKLIDQPTPGPD